MAALWRARPERHCDETTGLAKLEPAVLPSATAAAHRPDVAPAAASWILSSVPNGRRAVRVDADETPQGPDLDIGPGRVLAISAQGLAVVVDVADARRAETLSLLRPHQPPLVIARLNAALADTDAPDIRAVRHAGPDGQALTSWLYLPPPRPGAPPPPLVVRAYSGAVYPAPPRDLHPPHGTMTHIGLLVGHGYAVLVPSLPLPKAKGEPMAGLSERILKIVDQAASDPQLSGAFDPDRLAIWGPQLRRLHGDGRHPD